MEAITRSSQVNSDRSDTRQAQQGRAWWRSVLPWIADMYIPRNAEGVRRPELKALAATTVYVVSGFFLGLDVVNGFRAGANHLLDIIDDPEVLSPGEAHWVSIAYQVYERLSVESLFTSLATAYVEAYCFIRAGELVSHSVNPGYRDRLNGHDVFVSLLLSGLKIQSWIAPAIPIETQQLPREQLLLCPPCPSSPPVTVKTDYPLQVYKKPLNGFDSSLICPAKPEV